MKKFNQTISLFFYRCEITSSNYEITEKYQQMTVIGNSKFKSNTLVQFSWTLFAELPHKAPSITTDVNIKEYEVRKHSNYLLFLITQEMIN